MKSLKTCAVPQITLKPGASVKRAASALHKLASGNELKGHLTWTDRNQYEHEVNSLQRFPGRRLRVWRYAAHKIQNRCLIRRNHEVNSLQRFLVDASVSGGALYTHVERCLTAGNTPLAGASVSRGTLYTCVACCLLSNETRLW